MEEPAACPRCAYDLSAIAASWSGECPLRGTCSECGLEFVWGDLLNPRFHGQSLFFEHADRRRRAFRHTLLRLFRPRRLWEIAPLERPVRLRRMFIFVAGATALHWMLGILAYCLVYAAVAGLRGWGPPLSAAGPWLESARNQLLQAALPMLGGYFEFWTVWAVGARSRFSRIHVWGEPLPILGLLAGLLMPLAFVALPHTLRTCRVRRVHLLRVWAYSLPTTLLALQATLIVLLVLEGGQDELHRLVQCLVVIAWQFYWWRAAVRHYLRLPHANAVVGSAVVIGLLLGALSVLVFDGARLLLQLESALERLL